MHSDSPLMEFPALWVIANLLTALSYFSISYVLRKWSGFVRSEYSWLFAAFIGACGMHHCVMAFVPMMAVWHMLNLAQTVVDTVMMAISVVTAGLVVADARRHK